MLSRSGILDFHGQAVAHGSLPELDIADGNLRVFRDGWSRQEPPVASNGYRIRPVWPDRDCVISAI